MVNPHEDQNLRELSYANQKEETPRSPTSQEKLTEEESAAIAARGGTRIAPPFPSKNEN